jgi:hypothetical protein
VLDQNDELAFITSSVLISRHTAISTTSLLDDNCYVKEMSKWVGGGEGTILLAIPDGEYATRNLIRD